MYELLSTLKLYFKVIRASWEHVLALGPILVAFIYLFFITWVVGFKQGLKILATLFLVGTFKHYQLVVNAYQW